jgi:hypothetical protein
LTFLECAARFQQFFDAPTRAIKVHDAFDVLSGRERLGCIEPPIDGLGTFRHIELTDVHDMHVKTGDLCLFACGLVQGHTRRCIRQMRRAHVSRQVALLSLFRSACCTGRKSHAPLENSFEQRNHLAKGLALSFGVGHRALVARAKDETLFVLEQMLEPKVVVRFALEQVNDVGALAHSLPRPTSSTDTRLAAGFGASHRAALIMDHA